MHDRIKAHFQELEDAVRATGVPADRQGAIASAVRRLPPLYQKFRETNDSRYGDEITRTVQAILKDLEACPQARELDATFRAKLRLLHEELGIPALAVKPAPRPPAPKKARKKT
jgi:hypothetical protein